MSVYLGLNKKHNILSIIIQQMLYTDGRKQVSAATAPSQLHTCHRFSCLCRCLLLSPRKGRGVRQHLTGNNISPRGLRQRSYIHASEFGVYRFPLCKETQRRRTVCCRPLKPNRPNLQKGTCSAPLQTTPLSQSCGWKSCPPRLCLLL